MKRMIVFVMAAFFLAASLGGCFSLSYESSKEERKTTTTDTANPDVPPEDR